jgi:putative ABC transport system substrate-binding protein
MRRREFIALFGSTALAWPSNADAQHPSSRPPRLGILLYSTPNGDPNLDAFLRGLREFGYVEGQTVVVEYRYAAGRPERLPELAADLVRTKPDLLFSLGTDVAVPASRATRTLPLLFVASADPVQLGIVASLARPGGNATGVTLLLDDLASKRLELLKEAAPHVSRVAFVWNPDHVDNELHEAERAAGKLGIELHRFPVHGPDDLDDALRAASNARPDALYVVSSRQTVRSIPQFVVFASANRLPLAAGWGAWAQAGAFLSYGPNINDMLRQAAAYAARLLRGAAPAELPVQQPTKFELTINLKTARALGLNVPESLLARADEVIE